MRYLGIDYGTKRVGVALSDASGSMAFPHAVIRNTDRLMDRLQEIIDDNNVREIVVGHSLDMHSNPNMVQERINEFIMDATLRFGLPIHLEPEWFTTQEAIRFQGRNELKDASAAAIILNAYLNKL